MTDTSKSPLDRPLVTFALLAYNQEKYIRAAIEGAFSQNYEPLEIILSDDFSKDGTYNIMLEMVADYSGPHTVLLNRNDYNMGLVGHFNKVMQMAASDIIVLAAGDDVSLPNRVNLTSEELLVEPSVKMVSLGYTLIDYAGQRISSEANVCKEISSINEYFSKDAIHPNGAARGFKKEIFSEFGPMNNACPTEDTTSLLRALILGKVKLVPKQGILYRKHSANLSAPSSIKGMNLQIILEQYLADIDRAHERGHLTGPERRSARVLVTRRIYGRQIEAEVRGVEASFFWKIFSATFRGKFTFRSRLSMVRYIVKSHFFWENSR